MLASLRTRLRPVAAFALDRHAWQHGCWPVVVVAAGMMLGTSALLGFPPSVPLLLLGTSGAYLVYLLERSYLAGPEDAYTHPARLAWMRRHRGSVNGRLLVAASVCVATLPALRPATLLAGSLLAMAGGLYALPIGGFRLKDVWWLKPLLIALAWSTGAVVLPALEAGIPFTAAVVGLLAYRFLLVLANVLLVDLCDADGDRAAHVETLATRTQPTRVRMIAGGMIAGGVVLVALYGPVHPWPALLMIDGVGALLLGALALYGDAQHPAFSRWADLLMGWPLVVWLASLR